MTDNGSPVTSKLSDSDVLLAQMATEVHTDMTRPGRTRLKENKSLNAGHDDNGIAVEGHDVQTRQSLWSDQGASNHGSNASTWVVHTAEPNVWQNDQTHIFL